MKRAVDSMNAVALYKDNAFYKTMLADMQRVEDKSSTVFRQSKGDIDCVDKSAQSFIGILVGEGPHRNDDHAKRLRKEMNMAERLFETIIVQAHIKEKMWLDVKTKIDMKKPPLPFAAIGELCYSANNREKAAEAIKKVADEDTRIYMLIDYQLWQPAVEEVFATKNSGDYIPYLVSKCPAWVKDQVQA